MLILILLNVFLKQELNIVCDETNVSEYMREPLIALGKKYDYKIIAIELPQLSKTKAVARRMKNPHGQFDKKVWNSVWEQFDSVYESPSKDEGIDKILRIKK